MYFLRSVVLSRKRNVILLKIGHNVLYTNLLRESHGTHRIEFLFISKKIGMSDAHKRRKLNSLLKGHTKDGNLVQRVILNATSTVRVACLTSSDSFDTAPDGSGILSTTADQVMLNYVHLRGRATVGFFQALSGFADKVPCTYRVIVVYYKKPLLVADASGTLPPVTEVLRTASITSHYVADTDNSGRFEILYDKTTFLGMYMQVAALAPAITGPLVHTIDVKVPINRKCRFHTPATSTAFGGHYDTGTDGRVSEGLLCMYVLPKDGAGTMDFDVESVLNFTA